jgi:hypothetical protein
MTAYFVTVRRRGVPRLDVTLLVRADSREAAAELAAGIAELRHGGVFESHRVRRTTPPRAAVFDAVA